MSGQKPTIEQPTIGEPRADLTVCGQEAIHIPGAIQPQGALLAALAENLIVTHASANLGTILGKPASAALGRSLEKALGEAAWRMILSNLPAGMLGDAIIGGPEGSAGGHRVGRRQSSRVSHVQTITFPDSRVLRLRVYRSNRHICLDIEPNQQALTRGATDTLLLSVLESFKQASTSAELCELAVDGLKELTGYDRVMAYRFAQDGHGEVVAEAREPQLEPYLGLCYPADDVPPQARALFLRQRVCAIADTSYTPVPLLVDPALDDGLPLDLTLSSLRSVSPIHREYLRNMHVATSISVALVQANEPEARRLWGMLACHDEKPRIAGPDLLAAVAAIGQVVSLMLRSLDEAAFLAQLLERKAALRSLVDWLAVSWHLLKPSSDDLVAAESSLLNLVEASGALIRISGTIRYFGRTPLPLEAEHALEVLCALADGKVIAVDDLSVRHPELAACASEGSGALLMPLAQADGDAILWFRPERIRTVTWAGNPGEHFSVDPVSGRLSPRGSFAAWKAVERGHSVPWQEADLAIAREFSAAVAGVVAERSQAELAQLRFYDTLTGLPNRSLLQQRLLELERWGAGDSVLMFLDLDGFKTVNDTAGHAAGDLLLVDLARLLLITAGPGKLVARLGGDEFVVLCFGLTGQEVATLGESIRQAIERPFEVAGRQFYISSSIGIAVTGQTAGLDLVRAADMAMYAAKQAGGNRAVLFEPSLFDQATQQFELEQDMREALGGSEHFVLLYQPLFGMTEKKRRLVGFEALVRWRHPRRGWMSPALFIPMAEKSGLILPLGQWVLATALREGLTFRRGYPSANLIINVNISALELPQPGFCAGIAGALEATGFPPSGLCLEVTESVLTNAAAAAVLVAIRNLGVEIAIDDFGIGFSSLSYLRRLPADTVKLDRSFLADIEGDPRGPGFVAAVVALAHAAGKPVVFEGIETQTQCSLALAAGADILQGFFFAPPLSYNAAMELVAQYCELDLEQPALPDVLRR